MLKIPLSRITDITTEGISFRNDRGDSEFIELGPCANSYAAKYKEIQNPSGLRCIGERFFGAGYSYYEIYTVGHTQFYMETKTNRWQKLIFKLIGWNFHAEDFQMFYSIQKRLNENGWTTLDLS